VNGVCRHCIGVVIDLDVYSIDKSELRKAPR
jgi:hypothetical protein